MSKHVIIVGNGISGVTAARWVRKLSSNRVTIISDETPHFYSRTALMYVYMGHMRPKDLKPYEDHFWEKNNIDLLHDRVTAIDFDNKRLTLRDKEGAIGYDDLVLAVGSSPNKFNWPGQDLQGVGGLYHWQDLERMEKHSKNLERAVVVGGGLIGIEMAEMFASRKIPVTFLVRENSYWNKVLPPAESALVTQHIKDHGIDLRLGVNLDTIHDDGQGKACAITIRETAERIPCGFVGLTAGVHPNIKWLQDSSLETDRGILVDEHLATNLPHVYAIGDCAQLRQPRPGRRSVEAVWYTGRMMGETLAHNLCGHPTPYDPGIWFNSAKFFDIEYQVYGDIPATTPSHITSLHWQHANHPISLRINYHSGEGHVTGFNLMGMRYRHEVCEAWLRERASIQTVVDQLELANFDPEFYHQYEADIRSAFEEQSGLQFNKKATRSLDRVLSFFKKNKS